MNEFELGNLVMTCGIAAAIENDRFQHDVSNALMRYRKADFSGMEFEDIVTNGDAIASGEDRIFASYSTCKGKIWIITEWDRSVTTILFPNEY